MGTIQKNICFIEPLRFFLWSICKRLPNKLKPPGDGLALPTFCGPTKLVHRSQRVRHREQHSEA